MQKALNQTLELLIYFFIFGKRLAKDDSEVSVGGYHLYYFYVELVGKGEWVNVPGGREHLLAR